MLFAANERIREVLREHQAVSAKLENAIAERSHAQYPTLYEIDDDGRGVVTRCLCGKYYTQRSSAEKHASGCDGRPKRERKGMAKLHILKNPS